MSILQLHIVGIPYRKDIAGHVSEFLEVWSMMMLMVMAMPLIKDY